MEVIQLVSGKMMHLALRHSNSGAGAILFLILFIGVPLVVYAIYEGIKSAISKRRQRKLDEITLKHFGNYDFTKLRAEINSINSKYGFAKSYPQECPKCGGVLVFRDGRYGRFLGCNNYPKCKYTNNL